MQITIDELRNRLYKLADKYNSAEIYVLAEATRDVPEKTMDDTEREARAKLAAEVEPTIPLKKSINAAQALKIRNFYKQNPGLTIEDIAKTYNIPTDLAKLVINGE